MRYYANGQTENEEGVRRYRVAGFAAAVIAAILGVAASNFGQGWFAPWVGVMTTLAAAATAYGVLDRRQYLAGSYGAMVTRLSRVKELFADGTGDLPALVTKTEDLLQSEHGAWVERTTQTIAAPRNFGIGGDALKNPPGRCRNCRSGQTRGTLVDETGLVADDLVFSCKSSLTERHSRHARASGHPGPTPRASAWAPALAVVRKSGQRPPSLPFHRSRASGNPGISVTCPGPRLRGGDDRRILPILL
jgi:hypothetical protein